MTPSTSSHSLPLWPIPFSDYPQLHLSLLADGRPHPLVLVLPGGGYGMLAHHEGPPVADFFNTQGFHSAVLHYRLGPKYQHPAMLHDAQRALRLLRHNAHAWKISPNPQNIPLIGVLGFSAGGHLTASLATHFNHPPSLHDDLASTHSARPDAVVLCYPVIDLGQFRHHGSLNNLLGPTPDPTLVDLLSVHNHVREDSPPAFLWHTSDDGAVSVQNSLLYYQACLAKNVRAELHIYESGQHGMGLAEKHPTINAWPTLASTFFRKHLT